MNHIVIIGFMGSGKTRVGKRLAKDFNLPFIDVDRVVTKKMNLTMKEIFDRFGEPFLQGTGDHCYQGTDRRSGAEDHFSWIRSADAGAECQIYQEAWNCGLSERILCNIEEETGKFQQQSFDRR